MERVARVLPDIGVDVPPNLKLWRWSGQFRRPGLETDVVMRDEAHGVPRVVLDALEDGSEFLY
jgi:hypothetical protein